MKKLVTICLVCVLTATAWGTITTIDFNENGVGHFNGTPIVYGFGPSQGEGLFYVVPNQLEFEVVGDVVIYEPGTSNISDLLRFRNDQGETWPTRIYVISDNSEEGSSELADIVGIPDPQYFLNPLPTIEEGIEGGWNGLHYTPGVNDPGYITGGVTYIFTSDIPEPATICMLGIGALSLIRRKK